MKRLTSILLSIIMLLSVTTSVPLSVSAETTNVVKSGAEHTYTDQYGKWTYKLTDDGAGCIITKYDESMLDIEIPSSIDDLPVLEIESNTFNYYRKITSVKIPYSVTNIALRTFRDCENLTSIEVSPDNPCYSSIDGVLFNKTQTEIIQFPVNKLSDSYSSSYVIPDSVITVGDNAFYHCKNLTSVTIPDGVITIGDGAFLSCDITTLDLPDSVITIGNHSFGECDITALELPNSVTSIGDYAFDGCTGLTDIEIPYGVITIGERAFDNCTNLTSIKFPSSVTALGDPLFYACYNLTSVEVSPDNPYYSSIDGVLFDKTQSKLIYYPSGKPASSYIIPGSVTAIGDYAFTNCTSLTSMAIPSNVTAIGNYTFWRCYNLTNVTMTNSVTYIGMFSFSKCLSLSSITLSNSIHCILGSTFYDCISLTGITLPSELIYMSGDAFEYCRNLTDIYFPGSESEWNDINIFAKDYYLNDKTIHYNCENSVEGNITRSTYKDQYGVWGYELINNGKACRITSYDRSNNEIEIPGSINGLPVTEIGNNALYYAFLTNSITIPDSITVIGDYALTGCNISTLEIPNSVTTIGDHAFDSCWNLVNITIPNSVTTIGKNAFYYCYNLPSITIPNGVTSIGAYAFNDCFALTSITIPTSVTDIGDFAFSDCENLRDVYYRGNESEWADIAISPSNDYLINATIHYNCAPPAVSTYTDKYGVWNCKLRDDGTGYIITGYKGNKTEIEIPSFIADLPVLEIESSTFYDHNALTSVTIPASVIFIEDQTFNSSKLTEIKVSPNNNYFSSIDGVLFNKAQTTLIRYPCNAPTTYTIPDTVTTIAIAAFIQCELLTNVIIPDSVTYIRGGAFGGCFSLNNVIIPDSVTYLGAWGFDSCLSLTNITLSKKLTAINYRTFYVCPFTSIAIPDSVTYIGDYAFDHCRKLTDVTIPGSVTTIDEFAFEFCNNLTNVTISNGVTSINNCAFIYCSNLTSVTIPSSVTTIGDAAFSSCTKLTDIYYTGSESDWNNTTIGINNKDLTNANIHYNYVPQITGDVSGDGEVAVDDVIYTLKYIVGDVELTEAQLANADVSKDGNVTVLDSVLIQRMILEMN